LGTSLTIQQAHLINRYTKNVVLLYDADAPGIKAAFRGAEILFNSDLDVQVVNLGGNADPDSFLRSHSREDFIEAIKRRQSIVSFYTSSFAQPGRELSYQEKSDRIRDIIDLVDSIKDSLKRELMLKEIGEKLSADVKTIFKEYYRKKRSPEYSGRTVTREQPQTEPKSRLPEIEPLERQIGALVICAPELGDALVKFIEPRDITSPVIQNIISLIMKYHAQHEQYHPADVLNTIEDETLHHVIAELIFDPLVNPVLEDKEEEENRRMQIAEDIITRLKILHIERELAAVQEHLKQAQSQKMDTAALMKQFQALQQEKKRITQKR
jgi:DNA primase